MSNRRRRERSPIPRFNSPPRRRPYSPYRPPRPASFHRPSPPPPAHSSSSSSSSSSSNPQFQTPSSDSPAYRRHGSPDDRRSDRRRPPSPSDPAPRRPDRTGARRPSSPEPLDDYRRSSYNSSDYNYNYDNNYNQYKDPPSRPPPLHSAAHHPSSLNSPHPDPKSLSSDPRHPPLHPTNIPAPLPSSSSYEEKSLAPTPQNAPSAPAPLSSSLAPMASPPATLPQSSFDPDSLPNGISIDAIESLMLEFANYNYAVSRLLQSKQRVAERLAQRSQFNAFSRRNSEVAAELDKTISSLSSEHDQLRAVLSDKYIHLRDLMVRLLAGIKISAESAVANGLAQMAAMLPPPPPPLPPPPPPPPHMHPDFQEEQRRLIVAEVHDQIVHTILPDAIQSIIPQIVQSVRDQIMDTVRNELRQDKDTTTTNTNTIDTDAVTKLIASQIESKHQSLDSDMRRRIDSAVTDLNTRVASVSSESSSRLTALESRIDLTNAAQSELSTGVDYVAQILTSVSGKFSTNITHMRDVTKRVPILATAVDTVQTKISNIESSIKDIHAVIADIQHVPRAVIAPMLVLSDHLEETKRMVMELYSRVSPSPAPVDVTTAAVDDGFDGTGSLEPNNDHVDVSAKAPLLIATTQDPTQPQSSSQLTDIDADAVLSAAMSKWQQFSDQFLNSINQISAEVKSELRIMPKKISQSVRDDMPLSSRIAHVDTSMSATRRRWSQPASQLNRDGENVSKCRPDGINTTSALIPNPAVSTHHHRPRFISSTSASTTPISSPSPYSPYSASSSSSQIPSPSVTSSTMSLLSSSTLPAINRDIGPTPVPHAYHGSVAMNTRGRHQRKQQTNRYRHIQQVMQQQGGSASVGDGDVYRASMSGQPPVSVSHRQLRVSVTLQQRPVPVSSGVPLNVSVSTPPSVAPAYGSPGVNTDTATIPTTTTCCSKTDTDTKHDTTTHASQQRTDTTTTPSQQQQPLVKVNESIPVLPPLLSLNSVLPPVSSGLSLPGDTDMDYESDGVLHTRCGNAPVTTNPVTTTTHDTHRDADSGRTGIITTTTNPVPITQPFDDNGPVFRKRPRSSINSVASSVSD